MDSVSRTPPAARLIDGAGIAARLRERLGQSVAHTRADHGFVPGLSVIIVGEDPASQVYVRNKVKHAVEAGFNSREHRLPAETSERSIIALIEALNADDAVDGILVQLPLPQGLDPARILAAIDPSKDVDGLHVVNAGKLMSGRDGLVPCTPLGCMLLLRQSLGELAGRTAVVLGRSALVGKPMAMLLLAADCTVTIAHSRTQDVPRLCRSADILVAAIGRPAMVRGDWIRQGATVIDVGINRAHRGDKSTLVGDVDFEEASRVAGAITPVPGGVGPMTVACLLANTLKAAYARRGILAVSDAAW